MLDLSEALQRIISAVKRLPAESVSLDAAVGRILASPIVAPMDMPPFDNSAMDGFAVRSEEVMRATPEQPVRLELAGQLAAGDSPEASLKPGTCIRVFTGSMMPANADAVVMQEDTEIDADTPDSVLVNCGVRPLEHLRLGGEDIRKNAVVIEVGERLTPIHLSLIASFGQNRVDVGLCPKVALLATGSELIDAGHEWKTGKIFESNRIGLSAYLQAIGIHPKIFPLVPDKFEATQAALKNALEVSDVLITTGGASVGKLDFLKEAFTEIGGKLDFWKIAMRPGKPFTFGWWEKKCLFGLPGNPISALVTFLLLARPALLAMQGASNTELPTHPGTLSEPLRNSGDRPHFMRVKVDSEGSVSSAGKQGSHLLSTLAVADGLVEVPPRSVLLADSTVSVIRLD